MKSLLIAVASLSIGMIAGYSAKPAYFDPRLAVVRLAPINDDISHGSGVYLGNGYVLTAKHVVVEGESNAPLIAEFIGDSKHYATVVAWISEKIDAALVRVIDPPNVPAVHLACRNPVAGEPILLMGHPIDLNWIQGHGYVASSQTSQFGTPLDVAVGAGDSGGPLYDANNCVLGIMSALLVTDVGGVPSSSGYAFMIPSYSSCEEVEARIR